MPIGISTRPTLFTLPTRENTLVPVLCGTPSLAYQSDPFSMMSGMLHQVSTLFRTVGFPHSPSSAERTYFGLGSPARPSMEVNKAVDSPHTKAPAPRLICTSKENPLPRMFSPRRPSSRACSMAMFKCSMARGYSVRTYMNPWWDPMA